MTVAEAKQVLEDAGYCVNTLWNVQDIMDGYECTEEQARQLLDDAYNNDQTHNNFGEVVMILADMSGIEKKQ